MESAGARRRLFYLGVLSAVHGVWAMREQRRARRLRPTPLPPLEDTPRVSVLVAAWNEAPIINDHITAFTRLRYPNKQLILCAGGPDQTYLQATRTTHPDVTVMQQHPGEGKQRALQRCYMVADGEIIFLTDADCLLDDASFERTLAPVIQHEAWVATGGSRPLPVQQQHPLVQHVWFTDLYTRWARPPGRFIDGLLGRNIAIQWAALEAVGAFRAHVPTGTDYYLARQLLECGYHIRYVPESVVMTQYAETWAAYQQQQTRWLRNLVVHGLRFQAYADVRRSLMSSLIGLVMLFGPLLALRRGGGMLWSLAWWHVFLSRVRYMRFGALLTGQRFRGYWRLPLYMLLDFSIWARVLLQYPLKNRRRHW